MTPPDNPSTTGTSSRAALLVTAATLALVLAGFAGLDRYVYERVAERLNTSVGAADFYRSTRWVWDTFRVLGDPIGAVLVMAAILLLHPRRARGALRAAAAVIVTDLAIFLAKIAIGRVRPDHAESALTFVPFAGWRTDMPPTFPSGEATASFALAAVLCRFWPGLSALWLALAAGCGLSRAISGNHYLSDVLIGALSGWWMTGALLSAGLKTAPEKTAPTEPATRTAGP